MLDLKATKGFMAGLQPSATLAISGKAKEMKKQGLNVCSMSAGEPDFDTPQPIKDACIKALNEGKVGYTPASGLLELKEEVVAKFARDNGIHTTSAQIVVAPGAKFSVFSAVAALCGPGDEVLMPAPYWLSYPEMVIASGAKPVGVPTRAANQFELDPADLEKAITPNTRLLILTSPSNPTGAVYRRATLEKIAEIAVRHNIMVLADEIYEKLVYDADYPHCSIGSLNDEILERTITVNGFSKTYAMTGWRLGYLTAPLWLTKRIAAFQSHATSNPTTFAQYGGIAALQGHADADVEKMRSAFARRRDLLCGLLDKIPGLTYVRPRGAFYVLCDVSKFMQSSEDFCNALLEKEMLAVVPGWSFGAEGHVRLSYCCSEKNIEESVERLGRFCASF